MWNLTAKCYNQAYQKGKGDDGENGTEKNDKRKERKKGSKT